jgi:ABC-type uncharacterized transport system permease subunit
VPNLFDPLRIMRLFVVIVVTAFGAHQHDVSHHGARQRSAAAADDLRRAEYRALFPSGAVYPRQGFPAWMQAIATVDPFTYAVHAFRACSLKNTGFEAITGDILYSSRSPRWR